MKKSIHTLVLMLMLILTLGLLPLYADATSDAPKLYTYDEYLSKLEDFKEYEIICKRHINEIKNEGAVYYGTDAEFSAEIAELRSKISKIERRLTALAGDTSSSAAAERARLNAQLKELQAEYDELLAAKSRKSQIDGLEQEIKSFYKSLFGICSDENYKHTMGYWSTALEPTCGENGEKHFCCSRCRFYVVEYTEPLGHNYIEMTTKEPTCISLGEKTYYCTNDSQHFYTEAIPMTTHTPDLPAQENEVPTTCENAGSYDEVVYCSLCGAEISRETITVEKIEHTFGVHNFNKKYHWNECECGAIDESSACEHVFADEGYCTDCDYCFEENEQSLLPFKDVYDQDYYYEAVHWAYENGITGGVNASEFAPTVPCTRAQVATFLWRTFGSPQPDRSINPFDDVASDAYYYDAVLWAAEQGITTGTSNAAFSPDMLITRGQFVTFLWRAIGQPNAGVNCAFDDVEDDAYYANAVRWAVECGITTGTSAWTFNPEDNCTRAQVVTFLWRFCCSNNMSEAEPDDLSVDPSYYQLAQDAYQYVRANLSYPDSMDLVSAEAGLIDGENAVFFDYFALDRTGDRRWKLEYFTYTSSGRIASWSITSVDFAYLADLDISLIVNY